MHGQMCVVEQLNHTHLPMHEPQKQLNTTEQLERWPTTKRINTDSVFDGLAIRTNV
jgi:hypothetical protein